MRSDSGSERKRTAYEGRIRVRPIGRGIVLLDVPEETYLDDWLTNAVGVDFISGGEARVRIEVESSDDRV